VTAKARPARALLAGVLLVGGVLLAGCTSGASSAAVNTGPFGNGGTYGEECIPVPRGGVVSYGFDEFSNSGDATATVNKVALANSRGIRMLAAYVVPITGNELYGVLFGYPPAAHIPQGVQWPQRQRADGATIPRSRGHDVINLVLVLQPTAKAGWSRGIDVYYRESGQQYHLLTATRIRLMTSSRC
jgi:hypothetical protein